MSSPKRNPSKSAQDPRAVALWAVEAALEKKAVHTEIIDVRGKVDYTDYVVIMSGQSDRQCQAIARGIEEDLARKHKVKCLAVEGLAQATWVLMDFNDVIIHIFHESTRAYYDLESLWMDAERVSSDALPSAS